MSRERRIPDPIAYPNMYKCNARVCMHKTVETKALRRDSKLRREVGSSNLPLRNRMWRLVLKEGDEVGQVVPGNRLGRLSE